MEQLTTKEAHRLGMVPLGIVARTQSRCTELYEAAVNDEDVCYAAGPSLLAADVFGVCFVAYVWATIGRDELQQRLEAVWKDCVFEEGAVLTPLLEAQDAQ